MSETARIREAARALHRLRPEDTRSAAYVASSTSSAIDMASKYRELAGRAAQDVSRRLRGLEGLFGEDVARPIDAAVEELREMFYAALDMHELDRHDRDRSADELRAELLRYHAYLGAARRQEARRRLRGDAERPAWYVQAEDLFADEAPF